MKLVPYFSKPPLSRFVELIWAVKGTPTYTREKVLPNGAIELIINLGSYHKVVSKVDDRQFEVYRKSWIAGMQEDYILIEALRESDLIGIRFRPGGAYPFLRFPVSEITNRVIESDLILGTLICELRERLLETKELDQRIRMIEDFLLKQIDPEISDPLIAYALQEIQRNDEQRSIRELSREVGLSNKQLISRFRKVAGISPKLLSRIFRFQSVISCVKNQRHVCWTEVAQQCNYYDQAHMIREFHLFSDSNPSQYIQHRDDDENHIVVE
ncbi:MAG TPA: AraC family transcriptional regulator [Pyrinomonadaceae bacterium]|jgi:AraC-like DNA-binding protein